MSMTIQFTAAVYRNRRSGQHYIARADELGVQGEAANSMRGAIKNLKLAVHAFLEEAAKTPGLNDRLLDLGYMGSEFNGVASYAVTTHDSEQIVMPMPKTGGQRTG